MIRVFIGYDPRQPVAFQVAAHSVMTRASKPVAVTALKLSQLPITRRGLTDFTYSRFLVPWLCDYEGQAVFMDSDVLCLGDVCELIAHAYLEQVKNGHASVWVSKNALRFEWASVMVFDNERCQKLKPEYINDESSPLFPFEWTERVGEFPGNWNRLVGYDAFDPKAKLVHFTQGIPCWPETRDCDYSGAWWQEFKTTRASVSFEELMGNSVHAKPVHDRIAERAATDE